MVCLGLPVIGISKPFVVVNCIVEGNSKQVAEESSVSLLREKIEGCKGVKPRYYTTKTVATQLRKAA
jgi:hypothetical protein